MKRIFTAMSLVAVLTIIALEVGGLLSWQAPVLNLASIDILKISAPDPLDRPQECLDKPEGYKKLSCLRPYFERITNEVSVNAAITEAINLKQQGGINDCHVISHFIGEEALEKYNFNMVQAFTSCKFGCIEGCYHGVMDRSILNESDPYNVISKISSVCGKLGTNAAIKYECVHGVGHGLRAHGYLSIRDALNACNAFEPGLFESGFWTTVCADGIFMENMDQYIALDLDEDRLRKIIPEVCAPIQSIEPDLVNLIESHPGLMDSCISGITNGLMNYTGLDIERTEDLCEELQQQEHINVCKNYIDILLLDL